MAYSSLLRIPGAIPLALAGLIGRLPMGMIGLGLTLLIVGQSGSYTLATSVSAAMTITLAFVGPRISRVVDRVGQPRALPWILAVNALGYLMLLTAVTMDWPVASWFLFAVIIGASVPNIGAMSRARWARITTSREQRSSAFAMESVGDETAFVVGPMIATSLALLLFPAAPVLAGMMLSLIGGLWLAAQRRTAPPPADPAVDPSQQGTPLRFAGMATVALTMLLVGAMFAALNTSIIAFGEETAPALTGVLMAAFSSGSLVAGVVLGGMNRSWSLTGQTRLGLTILAVMVPMLAWVSSPWLFAPLAFLAGMGASTTMIGAHSLVERLVPRARLTESMSILASGLSLGMAVGLPLTGAVIDHSGSTYSFALAGGLALAAWAWFSAAAGGVRRLEADADAAEADSEPIRTGSDSLDEDAVAAGDRARSGPPSPDWQSSHDALAAHSS